MIIENHKIASSEKNSHNGNIFTGRDAAHKGMIELIKKKQPLPVKLKGQIIYYFGPCPAKPGIFVAQLVLPLLTEWIPILHIY